MRTDLAPTIVSLNDARLAQEVRRSLAELHLPATRQLTIMAKEGQVTIQGHVSSFHVKQRIVHRARQVTGLARLDDQIAVGTPRVTARPRLAALARLILLAIIAQFSAASFAQPLEPLPPIAPVEANSGAVQPTAFQHLLPTQAPPKPPTDGGESKKSDAPKSDKKPGDAKKTEDWVDMSTDKWTVKLGGHVQLDYVNFANASPAIAGAQNYFEFRRLRLVADGTGYGMYDFRLQMTLEPEQVNPADTTITAPQVKDAYFSANEIPWFGRWRIGNFFVPFGLEQVTNDTNNIFLERSIPTQGIFCADREVGMALYNCNDLQTVTWSTGIFIDSISEGVKQRIDDNQGYRLSGRLTWLPYYDEPSNGRYLIFTGCGVLHTDDQDNRVQFRARPQVRLGPTLINSGNLQADRYTLGNIEGAIVWGQFTLQTEAYLGNVNMLNGNDQVVSGAYAHLSYFLTGENRVFERFGQHGAQFARNQPFSNVFWVPGCLSWGAWEAKTRWSHLDLTQVGAGMYNDVTVGFNWYWSDRTRVMFDYIHPITNAQTVFGATTADILATRFDFNW